MDLHTVPQHETLAPPEAQDAPSILIAAAEAIGMRAKRPTITQAMILEAAQKVADQIADLDAKTIADGYMYPMDVYQLMREIDDYGDLAMSDVEELDAMDGIVTSLLLEAEKKWAAEHHMQPPFPIGADIKQGVIVGFYEYRPACYRVKERGCTQDGRYLIVRFESAVAA